MTIKVKIEHTGTHGAILIDSSNVVHVALRPGESGEAHVWEGSSIMVSELTDMSRTHIRVAHRASD